MEQTASPSTLAPEKPKSKMITTLNNKKGIAYHMILWIPKIIYFLIVLVTVFGFILLFSKTESYVGNIEARVLMHRIYFYPDEDRKIFSKYDKDLERLYLGESATDIDYQEHSEYLEKILYYEETNLPIKMATVSSAEKTDPDAEGTDIFRNEDTYERWLPIASFVQGQEGLKGKGRVFTYFDYRTLSDEQILKTSVFIKDD